MTTTTTVHPVIFAADKLPKGTKILGNKAKLMPYSDASLKRSAKVKAYVNAILTAGREGASMSQLTAIFGSSAATISVYFSYDFTRKGIIAGKLPNGHYVIISNDEAYTAKTLMAAVSG